MSLLGEGNAHRKGKKLTNRMLKPLHLRVTSFPDYPDAMAQPYSTCRRSIANQGFSLRLSQQTALRKVYYYRQRAQFLDSYRGHRFSTTLHRASIDNGDIAVTSPKASMKMRLHRRVGSEQAEPLTIETQGSVGTQRIKLYIASPVNADGSPLRVGSVQEVTKRHAEDLRPPDRRDTDRQSFRLPSMHSQGDDSLVLPTAPLASEEEERGALVRYISTYSEQHKEPPATTLQYYQLGELIGKGAFGKVITAVHKLTGKKVAIKTIEKALMAEESHRKKVFQEVFILNRIKDKRVIRMLEMFESRNHLLLVMEYASGGDLLHYAKAKGRLPEEEAKQLFREMAEGLQAIHRSGVLHRDIKLENILLSGDHVKICDFGVSRLMPKRAVIHEQCGTPAYIAPEILTDQGYEGFGSDIWSLGVCLYALVNGYLPFQGKTVSDLHRSILSALCERTECMSEDLYDLVSSMLRASPKLRISLKGVLAHPWLYSPTQSSSHPEPKTYHELKELGTLYSDAQVLQRLEDFGYSKDYVMASLRRNEMNHATASFYLLHEDLEVN